MDPRRDAIARALYECDPSQDDTPWDRLLDHEHNHYRKLAGAFEDCLSGLGFAVSWKEAA